MQLNYSILAKYYDKFTQNDCDYESWSQYLYRVASRHNARELVDLACGTGKMTVYLTDFGFKLIGVDISCEMLSVARTKCKANFVQQDIKKLALAHKVDMAVCVNDGINYLNPNELVPFFERVSASLKDGAPFVFDISSAHKLTKQIGNEVFYWDDERETLLWSNELDGKCVHMNLALFAQNSNGSYDRFDERHTQYIHTQSEILDALQHAHFTTVEVTANYGNSVSDTSDRLTFYAVKKS